MHNDLILKKRINEIPKPIRDKKQIEAISATSFI